MFVLKKLKQWGLLDPDTTSIPVLSVAITILTPIIMAWYIISWIFYFVNKVVVPFSIFIILIIVGVPVITLLAWIHRTFLYLSIKYSDFCEGLSKDKIKKYENHTELDWITRNN